MKKIYIFSFSKNSDNTLYELITWDNNEDLKLRIDNFHDQKNRLYKPYNSYWAFYTSYELTPTEEDIIGTQYGNRLKSLEEFNKYK